MMYLSDTRTYSTHFYFFPAISYCNRKVNGMTKHYYTVEEANRLLPQIKEQMENLRKSREELALMRLALVRKQKEQKDSASDFFTEEAQIEFSLLTARQQIDHLLSLSIEVKDIDRGLVDFLTKIDDKEAYLCWRDDEPSIQYWHGINEGYVGRKLI